MPRLSGPKARRGRLRKAASSVEEVVESNGDEQSVESSQVELPSEAPAKEKVGVKEASTTGTSEIGGDPPQESSQTEQTDVPANPHSEEPSRLSSKEQMNPNVDLDCYQSMGDDESVLSSEKLDLTSDTILEDAPEVSSTEELNKEEEVSAATGKVEDTVVSSETEKLMSEENTSKTELQFGENEIVTPSKIPDESEYEPMETEDDCIYEEVDTKAKSEDSAGAEVSEDVQAEIDTEVKDEDSDTLKKLESLEHDTEMVSEDELPTESIKPPLDTEAVSDEELPPNNTADHLLDTEAVSEDELPPVKRKKSESSSETQKSNDGNDDENQNKSSLKRSSSAVSDSGEGTPAKKAAVEPKPSTKTLPELDKYWKAVREDPADFTGWTYLLQYVDQEHDVEAAREAYDTFLSHYPYCYGYWRKYADYEKRKGDKSKSQDVFERGLAAIPLSVDLWLHYLNHIRSTHKDDEDYIRDQYKRAIDVCGIEFRSDRLWDSYIKWETEGKNVANVCAIYDKLFTVPTQGYKGHFENFEDFVMSNQPNKMLGVDEFLTLRADVLQKLRQKPLSESAPAANAPPGDESDEETEKSLTYADEETKLMREKIISSRKKVFKVMSSAVLDRWNFEEGIKRPYFHVKPLERCQLNNWRDYLEYEISQGNKERTIILFERCLIACALYDEFWVKYIRHLETLLGDDVIEKIRSVYERACTIHHPKKPMLALNWAYFEENQGDIDAARKILARIEKEVQNSLQIAICRINLERRSKNYDEASKLYEHYISSNKNKYATNALSIKYARFCQKILNDIDKGSEVLRRAIEKDKDNPRLYHQLLDLAFSKVPRGPEQEVECLGIINQFLERESSDIEHKVLFAQHKIEFLEDFGSTAQCVQRAVSDYMSFLKQMKDKRRKQFDEKVKQEEAKKCKAESGGHAASSSPSATYSQSSYSQSAYTNSNSSNQYQNSSSYSQPPYSQYNSQSDPNYNNYQNWNYSQTGYNNYNQGWGSYNYY